jgi:K+-sensing histidine kinase KdpD
MVMSDSEKTFNRKSIGRREEDRKVREQVRKHFQLFEVGQMITSIMNFDVLFEVVMEQTNQVVGSERSTVFLHDEKSHQLFSLVATGIKENDIRIPDDHGIAGWVFQNERPLIINDAYNDSRFYTAVDKATGFKTRNILCIPLINKHKKCIGALQALNKITGDFTNDDSALLTSVSHYVAIACENSRLYQELKVLDKAKERVINHLAHELKTPLAIISTVFGRLAKELKSINAEKLEKTVNRGKRNLNRLLELQEKIDDILNQRSVAEKGKIIHIIEDAIHFIEETTEENHDLRKEFLDRVFHRIESIYRLAEPCMEPIDLSELLHSLCDRSISSSESRCIELIRTIEKGLTLHMDRTVVDKVCSGLLKNAIENTPDEGRIVIDAGEKDDEICVDIRDFGVGISSQNQRLVFGGFFHTQDTDLYASKKAYEFNAGGSGSDLLRTQVFSERYGFLVDFDSSRCKFLPTDRDMCPGRISTCSFISTPAECFESGGSVFTLKFPLNRSGS